MGHPLNKENERWLERREVINNAFGGGFKTTCASANEEGMRVSLSPG